MDLLISMKAETILKGLYIDCNLMQMPTAQSEGYFIAEFREAEEEKLKIIKKYAEILENKLKENNNFLIEHTHFGFILKKRVDKNMEYIEAWERWVKFSRKLYEELSNTLGENSNNRDFEYP